MEAIAAVPESERATNLPVGSRSSEVSSTATVDSFPDIPLPPTKVAEPPHYSPLSLRSKSKPKCML